MSENSKTFVFKGIKFKLSPEGNLSFRHTSNPTFQDLFKLFNPHIQDIYSKKSRFSSRVFTVGYSKYFNTYYIQYGDEKVKFDNTHKAKAYLSKFLKSRYLVTDTYNLIWYLNSKRCPLHVIEYFIDTFGLERKINEFITLRLEDKEKFGRVFKKTVIYVAGQEFMQCKYLLFNIDSENAREYDDIISLDEAKQKLDSSMEMPASQGQTYKINFLIEFWGHVSNLQTWSDYNYDTCLLEKSLAFPLLARLKEAGDPRVDRQNYFKEEICERFETGTDSTRMFLIEQNYLKYLSKEEFESLFRSVGNRYEDEKFWERMTFQELYDAFRDSSNKSATFIYCGKHNLIASIFGETDSNILYLNCGCELHARNGIQKYDVSIIEVFKNE